MKVTLTLILYPEGHASHQGRGTLFSLPWWEGWKGGGIFVVMTNHHASPPPWGNVSCLRGAPWGRTVYYDYSSSAIQYLKAVIPEKRLCYNVIRQGDITLPLTQNSNLVRMRIIFLIPLQNSDVLAKKSKMMSLPPPARVFEGRFRRDSGMKIIRIVRSSRTMTD